MDNDYVYEHVKMGSTDLEYGRRTPYGWPFICRTEADRIFVITLPSLPEGDQKYDPQSYPLPKKTLETVETVQTALYDDATIPITLAHQAALIPPTIGFRVLELFAEAQLEPED